MKYSFKSLIWLSTCCITLLFNHTLAKVDQCHIDCNAPISIRPVGPTRPWHLNDDLGNMLKLTKPYPFSIAGKAVGILEFNFTMIVNGNFQELFNVTSNNNNEAFQDFVKIESEVFTDFIRSSLSSDEFISYDLDIIEYPTLQTLALMEEEESSNDNHDHDFQFVSLIRINSHHNGYEHKTVSTFFTSHVRPTLLSKISNIAYNELISGYGSYNIHETLNRTFIIDRDSYKVKDTFAVEYPNPYTEFCELGCSIFFSLPTEHRVELDKCTNQCDVDFSYNISVGYNDLAEVARLECRDGCQMALKRCQPGYFCSQVNVTEEKMEEKIKYEGGFMEHCPAGTYRDVDYSSVEECVPCPPGRFREATKGRNLESCTKCPPRTYNSLNGSSSILSCLRCPAGTFTNEPGSAFCICITPAACEQDHLPSPADAEKRNTVPYVGRW